MYPTSSLKQLFLGKKILSGLAAPGSNVKQMQKKETYSNKAVHLLQIGAVLQLCVNISRKSLTKGQNRPGFVSSNSNKLMQSAA